MISEPQTKSHSGQPVSVPAPGKLTLFLTRQQWVLAVVVGGLLAVCLQRYYENISPWIGGMLFLLGVITVHLRYASRFIVPFPHIALLMGALQYVLAAWISTQYPSDNPAYNIGSRIPTYLGYAVPVMVACMIGWGIGLARLRPSPPAAVRAAPDLLIGLDMLIVVGFIGVVLARHFQGTGLAFIFVLTANLRYVGALGRMLCKGSGWTWRLGLVLSLEVLFAAKSAMFHGLILWTVWTLALWVILFKPSWGKLTAVIAAAFLLLPALQESKWELRRHLEQEEQGGGTVTENSFEKSLLWLSYLRESVQTTITGNLDEYFIAETVVRYNQGWIVDRVMQIVPEGEPYARGETIKDAFVASLLPRFIMPNKVIAGGRANMEKYAGIQLNEDTSMNLGYAGEMYANFGHVGGIIACGVYALVLALVFRWICARAFTAPLWWCVMPYVGFSALKAEDGVAEILNWTVKATVVMAAVCYAFPAFRRALFLPEGGNQKMEMGKQKAESRKRRVGRRRAGRVMGAPAKP